MPDTAVTDTPQADKLPVPVTTPTTTTASPASTPAALWVDGSPYDPDKAKSVLAEHEKFKADAAEKLKRLDELEAKQREAEEAAMSEKDKLVSRATKVEQDFATAKATWEAREKALTEQVVMLKVQMEAQGLNIVDPDAAYALMDRSKLELDETGLPKNAKKVLEALLQQKPYLAGGTSDTPRLTVIGNRPDPKPMGRGKEPITPIFRAR